MSPVPLKTVPPAAHGSLRLLGPALVGASAPALYLDALLAELEAEIRCLVRANIELHLLTHAARPLPAVSLAPAEAQDLLRHLVIDACDAMPFGGQLRILLGQVEIPAELVQTELLPGSYVTLTVQEIRLPVNTGTSVPWAPYVKSRGAALAASYEALPHGHGVLSVSRVGENTTTLRIYFPSLA